MWKSPFLIVAALVLLFSNNLFCQKDTEFWFVAPEISQGSPGTNYDRPAVFRFSTYENPATITITQPANPGFVPQTISLPANTSGFFQLYDVDGFENKPPNSILNYGFLITATASVTAYYEIQGDCLCNPEIFPLKGKNALGTDFYVPFQTFLDNSPDHFPLPHGAFDIVATEDNTVVTIKPTKTIVGHAANVQFSVTLQKGQTWSGEAIGQGALEHPAGTKVTSTKPIAITMKDDLLMGFIFGGFCRDLLGDQLIPVDKTGTQYVVQKGSITGAEKVFIVGTSPNTTVKLNGTNIGAIGAGQTLSADIVGGQYFIETSNPAYVLQLTGIGCEVAGKILPPLDCNGSSSVRFVRPTDEPFWLELVTTSGNEGGFTLNGATGLIPASAFTPVPGSGGQYVAALIPFSPSEIVPQFSSIVANDAGVFQMGFLNGQESSTGTRFGFFSDFGKRVNRDTSLEICQGETLIVNGTTISQAGVYYDTVPGVAGCDTLWTIEVGERQFVTANQQIIFCEGDTITVYDIVITESGIYQDTIPAISGCDTIVTISAFAGTFIPRTETISFCIGDTIQLYGKLFSETGTTVDTLPGTDGCDTILTIIATAMPLLTKTIEINLCQGESIVIDGITYVQPATIIDTVAATTGCDTIVTWVIDKSDLSLALGDTVHILAGLSTPLLPDVFSSHGAQVLWQPPASLSDPNILDPVASPEKTTEYFLVVKDEFGCSATDSIVVAVRVPDCSTYIPNIFSPNDDGFNDVFTVFADQECYMNVRVLRIYDRWGELVFEKYDFPLNDYFSGWDGTFRKKKAIPGVYACYVEFKTYLGTVEKKFGDVTLLR